MSRLSELQEKYKESPILELDPVPWQGDGALLSPSDRFGVRNVMTMDDVLVVRWAPREGYEQAQENYPGLLPDGRYDSALQVHEIPIYHWNLRTRSVVSVDY